jgi:hypothetical protein
MAADPSATGTAYPPANDVERQLLRLLGDSDGYLRVIRTAPLYVPVLGANPSAQQPLVWRHDGVPHLAVFTSLAALRLRAGNSAEAYRVTDADELAARWPDPAWRLAINPGTPIGAYLAAPTLTVPLTEGVPGVEFDAAATFAPGTPMEQVMRLARDVNDPGTLLDALVVSPVVMPTAVAAHASQIGELDFPWLVDLRGPAPVINVFTSTERLDEGGYAQATTVRADFVAILKAWPDPDLWLAVNAGSAIATVFAGTQVAELLNWARGLARRQLAGGQPRAAG